MVSYVKKYIPNIPNRYMDIIMLCPACILLVYYVSTSKYINAHSMTMSIVVFIIMLPDGSCQAGHGEALCIGTQNPIWVVQARQHPLHGVLVLYCCWPC